MLQVQSVRKSYSASINPYRKDEDLLERVQHRFIRIFSRSGIWNMNLWREVESSRIVVIGLQMFTPLSDEHWPEVTTNYERMQWRI